MKYYNTKSGMRWHASIQVDRAEKIKMAGTLKVCKAMIGKEITDVIKSYTEREVFITPNVRMLWQTDNEYAETERYTTRYLVVYGIRKVVLKQQRILNPRYEDRPTCDICSKKVVRVSPDKRADDAQTSCVVCAKCRSSLNVIRRVRAKGDGGIVSRAGRYETNPDSGGVAYLETQE